MMKWGGKDGDPGRSSRVYEGWETGGKGMGNVERGKVNGDYMKRRDGEVPESH